MEMNGFYSKGRLITFACLTGFLIVAILFSYAKLMLKQQDGSTNATQIQERGAILDRNGKVLAIQTNVYNLSVTPSAIKNGQLQTLADVLGPIIGIAPQTIENRIQEADSDFLYLKKRISQSEYEDIISAKSEYGLTGIRLDKAIARSYPENSLASQLIGFMGDSGEGLAGVEFSFQAQLAPKLDPTKHAVYGRNVLLTIDSNLQYKLEQLCKQSMEQTQAESMMLIAAEAKTGEILSYISLPSTNLNNYRNSRAEERVDRPAMYGYEPGSVFKIFTVATCIDAGVIDENEVFVCDGVYDVRTTNGERVRITCLDHHGPITARQALQYSCNDAIAQMSDKINAEYFLQQIRNFGFGKKTGVEVPGETEGIVKSTTDRLWSGRSKQTIAMGQEISVSALQMVQGVTALANGGRPVQLTILSKLAEKDGTVVYNHVPEVKAPVISEQSANYLLSCMETTALAGTGSKANIADISIGVKTGTAQMLDEENGGYSDTDFLSNCVAIFPIEDPQIILYIVITKAKGETYAGRIVAPVIHDAANIIIDYLGMHRDSATSVMHPGTISIPREQTLAIGSTLPNFLGSPKRLLMPLINRKDIIVNIQGDGWVVSQNPPAGTPITENMVIEFILE